MFNSCIAKAGLVYYSRLLIALYQRDPSVKAVRQQIQKLFASDQWKELPNSSQAAKQQFSDATHMAQKLNELLQTHEDERDLDN